MLSSKMKQALNKQINFDFFSSYLYLAMAADFDAKNLDGCAAWMYAKSKEEWGHGMKIFKYINDQGEKVTLEAIETPRAEWKSPLEVFEQSHKHEQEVTKRISSMMKIAQEENDFATLAFLQWFITEQVEEENNVATIADKLRMVGDNPQGIFMMDRALASRAS